LKTLIAFRDGDLDMRLPAGQPAPPSKIADALDDIFTFNARRASEVIAHQQRRRQR